MTIIYTDEGLLEIPFAYEQLEEICLRPQEDIPIRYLPFGSHNDEWVENKRRFMTLWGQYLETIPAEPPIRRFLIGRTPTAHAPLPPALQAITVERLGERFHSCPNAPGPVPQPDQIARNWIDWVLWRLMKHGDEPDWDQVHADHEAGLNKRFEEDERVFCYAIHVEATPDNIEWVMHQLERDERLRYVTLSAEFGLANEAQRRNHQRGR